MFHKFSVRFDERELQAQSLTGQMRSPALAQVGERILFMNVEWDIERAAATRVPVTCASI
ncbi:MAG: hypothetical protein H0T92_12505 [Pyrinomonadaceae bacterium]|nr:hypothetical protein [Pyrinomonadaceae bacterium]